MSDENEGKGQSTQDAARPAPGQLRSLWMSREEHLEIKLDGYPGITRGSRIGINIERAGSDMKSSEIYATADVTLKWIFEQERKEFLGPQLIVDLQNRIAEYLLEHGPSVTVKVEPSVTRSGKTSVEKVLLQDGTELVAGTREFQDFLAREGLMLPEEGE